MAVQKIKILQLMGLDFLGLSLVHFIVDIAWPKVQLLPGQIVLVGLVQIGGRHELGFAEIRS